ncbi:MAG: TonB-dependent receptor, partial [Steroidobacteraceae bacterium]
MFQSTNTRAATVAAIAGVLALPIQAAETAEDSKGGLEEIVVTAQRREERLQDVPIAVVALSSDALQAKGVSSTEALAAAVPGLTFTRIGASGTPFIRGVGSSAGDPSSEPSVATYVDGVYIASPNVNLFEFNAIEHLEVLKGPQGTLFGRNATGGVIQVQTKDPSFEPAADISLGYGNYETKSAAAYVTAGLSDTIAFNLAGSIRDQDDGYGDNQLLGVDTYVRDEQNIRGKLLFKLSDDTQVMLAGDYLKVDSTGEDYKLPNGAIGRDGAVVQLDRYDTQNGLIEKTDTKSRGGALTVDHDWGAVRIKSITAYRKATGVNIPDVDMVPDPYFDAILDLDQDNWSQEFHLASSGDSRVTWLLGAFYYDSTAGYSPASLSGTDLGGIVLDIYGKVRTKSASVFAQGTTEIAQDTNLTLGLRYTHEKQEYTAKTDSSVGLLAPEDSVDQSFDDPTWRIAIDHKFTPDVLAYVSYNRGIKSGGYGPLSPLDTAAFDPEQLDAYEVGVKSELLDRRLRLNASAFWYDYKDIQVQIVQGSSTFTQNAASARIRGIDLEMQAALGAHFTLSGNLAYTDGEYEDYENAGSYGLGV